MSISTRSYHNTSYASDVLQNGQVVGMGWENELKGRIHAYPGTVDDFITTLVPCATPFTFDQADKWVFWDYKPQAGKEVSSYPYLLVGLKKLVAGFEADRKLSFRDTSNLPLDFPFRAFKDQHHQTKPDISISFPGEAIPSRSWEHIASVIEVKATEGDDPFPWRGEEHEKHVAMAAQVAKNARNLMLAHGFLASFVIGIYGRTARIARFDHTSALVSPRIDLERVDGVKALQKFFWHFTHPVFGSTVACSDPTVARLSAADQAWIRSELQKASAKDWEQHVGDLANGRRIEVYDQDTRQSVPYLLYHLIDVNGRLFSRATMVWRAIEDTRMWKDDELVCNPARSGPVKPQIVKEAWRQVVRTAEADFYRRLNKKGVRTGVATMVCGGDLGRLEIDLWQKIDEVQRNSQSDPSSPAHLEPEASTSSRASTAPASQVPTPDPLSAYYTTFCSFRGGRAPAVGDGTSDMNQNYWDFPLPRLQHYTWSMGLINPQLWHLERSHIRMVIDKVGRPLTQFTCTRELIEAVRDAVLGHKRAWEDARVLHRDISVGNILIADEPTNEPNSSGFLHDFDYSWMENGGPDDVRQAGRTGTYYFMARELVSAAPGTIHDCHHDLESFYWVIIWVILRHTSCQRDSLPGSTLCQQLFKWDTDALAAAEKKSFLLLNLFDPGWQTFVIDNNPTLTKLVEELTTLVWRNQAVPENCTAHQIKLTHDALLDALNAALAPDQIWPTNDWQPCTLLDDHAPRIVPPEVVSTPQGVPPAPETFIRRINTAQPAVMPNPTLLLQGATHSVPWELLKFSHTASPAGRQMDTVAEDEEASPMRQMKRQKTSDDSSMRPMKRQKTGDDTAPLASGSNCVEASQADAGAGSSQGRRGSRGAGSRGRRSANIRKAGTRASRRLAEKSARRSLESKHA
ncbi:hypothetical protein C2E23DRAFT_548717 [Lenzites betulinus]|nr:hypothetical protein C2E23DRAFT_548717 [Lenzites betulinus]